MSITSEGNGKQSNTKIDRVGSDNLHMTMLNEQGQPQTEFIVTGGKFFIRQGDGKWLESPDMMSSMMKSMQSSNITEKMVDSIKEARLVGPDVLDGQPVMVFEYQSELNQLNSQFKMWVGVTDGLPHKMVSQGELNKTPYVTTMIFSDFNGEIKIEAPVSTP